MVSRVLSLLSIILIFGLSTMYGQGQDVSGTVTEASTGGEVLPGVNVVVKGTSMGGATDAQGSFNLQVPSLQDTLVFSFIGYQTREIPINGRTEINISLSIEALSGDELVVVGYGTQEKQNLTGSISFIGGAKIS